MKCELLAWARRLAWPARTARWFCTLGLVLWAPRLFTAVLPGTYMRAVASHVQRPLSPHAHIDSLSTAR